MYPRSAAMMLSRLDQDSDFFSFFDQTEHHTIYAKINREHFKQYHNNKRFKRHKNKYSKYNKLILVL